MIATISSKKYGEVDDYCTADINLLAKKYNYSKGDIRSLEATLIDLKNL